MTPEQFDEARRLVEGGATYAEVADHFSVPYESVMTHFSGTGLHREMYRQRNNIIFALWQEGKTAREIGEIVGLSTSGAQNIIAKQKKFARQK